MNLLEWIQKFWDAVFTKNPDVAYYFYIATVFLLPVYTLGVLRYFDALMYRVSQIIIRPFNILIDFLDRTAPSLNRLAFRFQVANFVLVLCAGAMLLTEFGLIQDFLEDLLNPRDGQTEAELAATSPKLKMFGLELPTSAIISLSYLSIATLLGFFVFELSTSFKKVYQIILVPNEVDGAATNDGSGSEKKFYKKATFWYMLLFFFALLVLALIQGAVGIEREKQASKEGILTTQSLFFVTGFLIPIVAGIGLMSLHIFVAQVAMLLKLILQICKDLVIAICLKVIALVDFVSALITKTIILFLGVSGDLHKAIAEEEKKLEDGKDKKVTDWLGVDAYKAMIKLRFLKRLAPVERDDDSYSIYILDKLDITSEYANAFWKKKTLFFEMSFVLDHDNIAYEAKLNKKLSEMILRNKTFDDIAEEFAKMLKNNFIDRNLKKLKRDYEGEFDSLDKSQLSFWVIDKDTFEPVDIRSFYPNKNVSYSDIKVKNFSTYDTFLVRIGNELENETVEKVQEIEESAGENKTHT
jgi:hypothetical protein